MGTSGFKGELGNHSTAAGIKLETNSQESLNTSGNTESTFQYDPDIRAQHLLDLLPGLGGQMQDPEISVVVELLPVGRGKLPPKDPELPPSCGHHSCLQEGRAGSEQHSKPAHNPPRQAQGSKPQEQQQLSGTEGRIWIKRCSWFS